MIPILDTTAAPRIHGDLAPAAAPASLVYPAASALELAAAELGHGDGALAETLEDMSFALGGRVRDARGDGKDKATRELARLQPLLAVQALAAEGELATLMQRFADADDPLAEMKEAGLDAGQMAWLVTAMLGREGLGPRTRERWRKAWERLCEQGGWELALFARLEGIAAGASLSALGQLHRRAHEQSASLAAWLRELRDLRPRGRALRALIRTLSYELSGVSSAPEGARLAGVIGDLQRVLLLLGMEEHCRRIAGSLSEPAPDGERVLEEVIAMVDQSWLHRDWFAARCDALHLAPCARYGYIANLLGLARLLPDACLRDEEQRANLVDALSEYRDALAEQE
ncbi:TyeA family type III secretion system gatekeeper subunit [Paludibacterium yongneupense]|uniref:TyeA family type III secretion system gatekeeper subunit n=1 Tax=Paludibacterium yongneupense TaxID=400061 RepID=UPI00040B1DDC|nr:TyeA family type III secretion system gatekeeper subunit [Paludibacterium yongneupense]